MSGKGKWDLTSTHALEGAAEWIRKRGCLGSGNLLTVQDLAFKLADEGARQTIRSFCSTEKGWFDTSRLGPRTSDVRRWVAEAVHYLAMRGQLTRARRREDLVKFQ
jgi:hypothetical protein